MKKLAITPQLLSQELRSRFALEGNTLKRAVKANPKDRIELEIGDAKQPDTFFPQAKIMRWDNEVNASFRYVDREAGDPIVETAGKVIKYVKPKTEFHAYELDPGDAGEDGGLEIELLLKERPDTNKFEFTIQTKGLNFYYQPELTLEEIEQGAQRPENVVGSYAVYHKTKGGMNRSDGKAYKTGKAFHIYRPHVTDAEGNEIWGDLHIDTEQGILSVTVNQDWLDKAIYPVVVDPTLGYTSAGASTGGTTNDYVGGLTEVMPEDGDLSAISIFAANSSNETAGVGVHLYNDSVANHLRISTLIGSSGNFTLPALSGEWYTHSTNLSGSLVSGERYVVGIEVLNDVEFFYDTVSDYWRWEDTSRTYGTIWTDTPGNIESFATNTSQRVSIYATYTVGGGEPSAHRSRLGLLGVG